MKSSDGWRRYQEYLCVCPTIGLELDVSRMRFEASFLDTMAEPLARALVAMEELERGAKVNRSEDRMVGHYWLRAPELAPDDAIRSQIRSVVSQVKHFADDLHAGVIKPQRGDGFFVVLVVGIGGSVLGSQLVADALGSPDDPVLVRFLDNIDPDGIRRTLVELDETLEQTLTVVISKSGDTTETCNAAAEVAAAYKARGLDFAKHAVAITCEGSRLDDKALRERWLRSFPIWDWVGGRTSVTSAVGLLPAALLRIDIDAFLEGARAADVVTREKSVRRNPAALLSAMWHHAVREHGKRNMIVLPYRDALERLGRFLQQLVMESIGKEKRRNGQTVHEGISVLGNKGTTDQHALVQQLRDGPDDFFATFVTVRRDETKAPVEVEEGVTAGDFLDAFRQGTRAALTQRDRESITITLDRLDARRLGALIAVFERTVGLYAELIDVNAYDQPGVDTGKLAAAEVLDLRGRILSHLRANPDTELSVQEIADAIGNPAKTETIHHILEYAAANGRLGIQRTPDAAPATTRYRVG